MKEYVCIDIGGTAIKAGVLDENARIIEQLNIPTEAMQGGSYVLARVKKIIERYIVLRKITGICISTTGMVDAAQGSIIYANENMPGYMGINLKKEIERTFGILCEVENDVNCAGLAEYWNGAAQKSQSALCMTIGTGIGGCAIVNGRLLRGISYSACEVGYMNINGNRFENQASTTALVKKVAERKKDKISEWNGKRILESAEKNDKICIEAINEMAEILGLGIANICYVLNPEIVVLGGGIMQRESILTDGIRKSEKNNLLPAISSHMRLELAHYHNAAGMTGAWYCFRKAHEF